MSTLLPNRLQDLALADSQRRPSLLGCHKAEFLATSLRHNAGIKTENLAHN